MTEQEVTRFKDLGIGDKFSFGCEKEWYVKITSEHSQSQYGEVIEAGYQDRVTRRSGLYTHGCVQNIIPLKETSSVEVECRNSITSAREVYEWLHTPPTRYFAYVKLETDRQGYGAGILTTWTGEKLGNVHAGRVYRCGFGYDTYRRSISVVGTNGVKYYGTYYVSSGDYARITARKHQ